MDIQQGLINPSITTGNVRVTNGFNLATFDYISLTQASTTNTYTVTSLLSLPASKTTAGTLSASTGSSAAILTLQAGASQEIVYVAATDINSSGGLAVWDYQGTLLRSPNWFVLPTTPATVSEMALDLQTGNLRYVNGKVIVF